MKLSSIQQQTLHDIADGITFSGRTRTLASLKRKGLIEYEPGEEPWLTDAGEIWLHHSEDKDSDAEDVVEAAYFLGKQATTNPQLLAIAAVSFILGNMIRRK